MSETEPRLHPVDNGELDAIAALVNASYRGEGGWTNELDYIRGSRTQADHLRRDLAEHPGAILLALRDDRQNASGAAGVVRLQPLSNGVWELSMLTIRPELQDRGYGRLVLDAAEAFVAENGGRCINITVLNIRAPLIAWYERRGYRATGEVREFPYRDSPFGTPLRNDLAFVVFEKPCAQGVD